MKNNKFYIFNDLKLLSGLAQPLQYCSQSEQAKQQKVFISKPQEAESRLKH
ncbi:hypothetical protein [Thiothrix lacustris]|uniref:hypothetical protein n=1 Tax=Thiothrix lacustris TaxID=525917 RepID=UPI0012EC8422|nr:hypothetical protein [Thiothrix lacustris]